MKYLPIFQKFSILRIRKKYVVNLNQVDTSLLKPFLKKRVNESHLEGQGVKIIIP